MPQNKTIAELPNFIVLDDYTKRSDLTPPPSVYQSESDLERELIADLQLQGYEYLPHLITPEALVLNVREQLQQLNGVQFSDAEWERFRQEYLDKPNDTILDKTRKVQDDYIYDFVFDDGHL